jgi:hypothetical protein
MLRLCSRLAPELRAPLRPVRQAAVANHNLRAPKARSAGNAAAARQTDPAALVAPALRVLHEAVLVIPELRISRFFPDAGGFEIRTP